MSFDLADYVDVAERIRILKDKYPESVLQSEIEFVDGGVMCKAYAYRTPEDPRPGIGHAWEPIPGKTPYTRDSEVMNAETSVWGRAIVALGFETKKIASREEVQNRSAASTPDAPSAADALEQAKGAYEERAASTDVEHPSKLVIHFGKNKGTALGVLSECQLEWYATSWKLQDDPSEYDHALKAAAVALMEERNFLAGLPFA